MLKSKRGFLLSAITNKLHAPYGVEHARTELHLELLHEPSPYASALEASRHVASQQVKLTD
jgi:hypothetical protein